jgi:DnaJ-class molecular chaperone
MNYYEILSVDKNSSQDEIKKSFRKLSMINHPDKGGDASKFQEINSAYQVLSDIDKRKAYDHQLKFGLSNDDFDVDEFADMNNLFNNLFKDIMKNQSNFNDLGNLSNLSNLGNLSFFAMGPGMMPPGMMPPGMMPPGMMPPGMMPDPSQLFKDTSLIKPEPISIEHVISFEDSYNGINDDINFTRWLIINTRRVNETKTIPFKIPPGINDNQVIIIENQGNFIDKNNIGDIEIIIKVHNDTEFKRSGDDLIFYKNVSFKESLCGFSFKLNHISGKSFELNNNNVNTSSLIYNGFEKVIPNFGFYNNNNKGNLIIHFTVDYPKKLTPQQIQSIREIL